MSGLNQRIKERRLALDLTLAEVAERLGVKEATVQRYESGEIKNIKHETIGRLATMLQCSPMYLMGWEQTHVVLEDDHKDIIRKYEQLDAKGKHTVNTVLEMEYRRCAPLFEPIAAHNDDMSEDELLLMQKDIEQLQE